MLLPNSMAGFLDYKVECKLYCKCQFWYLEHERRVEHVLRRQIETFIQILVGKLSE